MIIYVPEAQILTSKACIRGKMWSGRVVIHPHNLFHKNQANPLLIKRTPKATKKQKRKVGIKLSKRFKNLLYIRLAILSLLRWRSESIRLVLDFGLTARGLTARANIFCLTSSQTSRIKGQSFLCP